jgi:hypothetical protein
LKQRAKIQINTIIKGITHNLVTASNYLKSIQIFMEIQTEHKDKMNKQLDAQILELEERFNLFLKELEEDFDFVPAAVAKGKGGYDDDILPELDNRITDIEKRYASVDRKYTIVLALTTTITLSVLGYLAYILFGK